MLEQADLVAFVACSDLEVSNRFYSGVLGLRLLETSAVANAYDVCGTQLRVTLVDRPSRAPYTVLGWRVVDLPAVVDGLTAAGVQFVRYDGMGQDEHGIWHAPSGAQVAWFTDPDANLLSLTAFPDSSGAPA